MKINTVIKKYQNEIIQIINQAGAELPPAILQLILQNIMYQVNMQVNATLENEAMQTNQRLDNQENDNENFSV